MRVRLGELVVVGVVRMESVSLVVMVDVAGDMWVLGASGVPTAGGEEAGSAREEVDIAELLKYVPVAVVTTAAGGASGGGTGSCGGGNTREHVHDEEGGEETGGAEGGCFCGGGSGSGAHGCSGRRGGRHSLGTGQGSGFVLGAAAVGVGVGLSLGPGRVALRARGSAGGFK